MFLAVAKVTTMLRKLLLLFCLALVSGLFAQEKEKKQTVPDSLKVWFVKGKSTLSFNQAAFNKDFPTAGINSLALDLNGTFELNYDNAQWRWDNKIIASYGVAKVTDEDFQKSNDQLVYNGLVGLRASKNWDYSFIANLKTQFSPGREGVRQKATFIPAGQTKAVTKTFIIEGDKNSDFFSPAVLEFGPGMSWKKGDNNNFKFNLAPATSKITFVDARFTEEKESFGVEKGESLRYEIGASAQGYLKVTIFKNVSWENILNLYSNYEENPQNIDLDYLTNIVIRVNKYITSNFTFQTIYDDDITGAFQVRESFGLGVSYGF